MKRFLCVCMAAMLAASLVTGCGKSDSAGTETTSDKGGAGSSGESGASSDAVETTTVVLGEYKGLTYTPLSTEVTDEDVEEQIQNLLNQYPTMTPVSRPAKDGDTVNIDYVGKKGGVAFDGGTAAGYDLKLGSDTFIDGFEDGLIGVSKGEKKTLNLTFPENFGNADLAGQEVTFEVTVNDVKESSPAVLNDDFVKSYTEYTSVEELRTDIRKQLEEYMASLAEVSKENELLMKAMENAQITVSTSEVETYYQQLLDSYEKQATAVGTDLETMVSAYYGMDVDTFKLNLMAQADTVTQQRALIREIAAKEGITAEDAEKESLAAAYGYDSVESMQKDVPEDIVEDTVLTEKVVDLIVANAVEGSAEATDDDTEGSAANK